ncbi:MAG: type II secretion system protein GspL [Polymorphobacter sp.]
MIRTLVFLDDAETPWLRLAGGVVTRGDTLAALPALEGPAETIAVVPGDAVVLHWVELPVLTPAQGAAAARQLAADVSAAPIEATHVALGPVEADGWRALALVDSAIMHGWLARLAAAGVEADRMVPAPLLLPLPAADGVSVAEHQGQWLLRGARLALAAEPGLATLLVGDQVLHPVTLETGLAMRLAAPLLDLRQGEFARLQLWRPAPARLRRLALLALALLVAVLGVQVAALLRHSFAADRMELQLADAARSVLPRGTIVTDPRAQVAARLASLGGDGAGLAQLAAPLLTAIEARPAVTLVSLGYAADTGMTATLAAPAADGEAIAAAMTAAGLDATLGNARDDNGLALVDLMVRRR